MSRRRRYSRDEDPGFRKERLGNPPRRHPKSGPTRAQCFTSELTMRLSQALIAGDTADAAHVLGLLEYVVGKAEAARIAKELKGGA